MGSTERYVVSTVEPYYRVIDTADGHVQCVRRTLKGALLQARLLNLGADKPSVVEVRS